MSNQTPLNDLLKPAVEEAEETADASFEEASSPPEEAESTSPQTDKPKSGEQDASAAAPDKDAPEEDHPRRMTALPKWAHERIRANDEKAAAAERRARELHAAAEAAERRNREWEEYFQQMQDGDQQSVAQPQFDPSEIAKQMADAVYETRVQLGWDRAVEKFGAEQASLATHWAADIAKADPRFDEALRTQPDPVGYAVMEFRKAQTLRELEEYGGDLDALVRARMKSLQPEAQFEPDAGDAGARTKTSPRDFAGAASASAARSSGPVGPTPLGELLNIKRR